MSALVDLAAKRLGGMVVDASDEFFAPKENLLEPGPPTFDPAAFGDRGKVMDGWETRRSHDDAHADWCVVRLGVPGVVEAVVVDTRFFTGNHPAAFTLEGSLADGPAPPADGWFPLVDRTDLAGDAEQRFPVEVGTRVSHVRLVIHPDGGVARLRVLGRPLVDLYEHPAASGPLDLAATIVGGRAVAASNAHYASPANLVAVGDAIDMSDGWETRRRRGPGQDWAIVELAASAVLARVEVDTTHFKGNPPDACALDGVAAPGASPDDVADLPEDRWTPLVPPTPMAPHWRHVLPVATPAEVSHVRLRAIPDGGVARLRAIGTITEDGWRQHGVRLLDALPAPAAAAALRACCGASAWVDAMVARRPFATPAGLLAAADEVAEGLGDDDWREAFAAHPRIGERAGSGWSSREQAGTAAAEAAVLDALAKGNRAYEERFGHVFLIRAAGRSADEMLAALRERLDHDPATELRVAAEQQREITRLRLDALLREGHAG